MLFNKATELEELRLKGVEIPMTADGDIDYSGISQYSSASTSQLD
jgi:hypothetical protein